MKNLLLIMLVSSVSAENLYQYTDNSGNLVITNKKTSSGTRFYLGTNENARHKILEEELQHEKAAINQIRQSTQTNSTIALYNNDISLHQKNIDILTKQLNQ